jgi:hypothetical protein
MSEALPKNARYPLRIRLNRPKPAPVHSPTWFSQILMMRTVELVNANMAAFRSKFHTAAHLSNYITHVEKWRRTWSSLRALLSKPLTSITIIFWARSRANHILWGQIKWEFAGVDIAYHFSFVYALLDPWWWSSRQRDCWKSYLIVNSILQEFEAFVLHTLAWRLRTRDGNDWISESDITRALMLNSIAEAITVGAKSVLEEY